jgi:hypothetical protein
MRLGKIVAAATFVAAVCLVIVACGDQSSTPVSPSSVTARVQAVDEPPPVEICGDGKDNDGDGQIDEGCEPPPPPPGPACSPGYWKNHLTHFNSVCGAAAALPNDVFTSCSDLLTAITCKGSEPGCTGPRRQAAASALNTVSGCTESD